MHATGNRSAGRCIPHRSLAVLLGLLTGLLGGRGAKACDAPVHPVALPLVTLSPDGSNSPVLHLEDPNPATEVTGYTIYRSATPSQGLAGWSVLARDAGDEDPATPGIQWSDTSGENPATGLWFYLAAPYHAPCNVEGPWRTLGVTNGGDATDAAPGDARRQARRMKNCRPIGPDDLRVPPRHDGIIKCLLVGLPKLLRDLLQC